MRRVTLLISCLWFGWSVSPASAAMLYGVAYDGDIYKIDQLTGTRQLFLSNTGHQWHDATDSPTPMTFFATDDGTSLYRIDTQASTITLVGAYGAGKVIKTLAYAEPTSPGGSGVLYGSDFQNLYTIDMTTGAATLVAPINGVGDIFIGVWSMDYDSAANRLYLVNQFGSSSKLYYVNPSNGQATLISALGGSIPVTDIWYDRDSGKLYGAHKSNTQLYEINTTNGQVTPIGVTPTGLAACEDILGLGGPSVPEPGMVAMLGFGAVGLVFRMARRRGR